MSCVCERCGGYFSSEILQKDVYKYIVFINEKPICLRCANIAHPHLRVKSLIRCTAAICEERAYGCINAVKFKCCCGMLLCNSCVEAHFKWHKSIIEAQKSKDQIEDVETSEPLFNMAKKLPNGL